MNRGGADADTGQAPRGTARGWAIVLAIPVAAALVIASGIAVGFLASRLIQPAPSQAEMQRFVRVWLTSYTGEMAATVAVYAAVLLAIWLLLPKRGPASLASYFGHFSFRTVLPALGSGAVFAFGVGVVFTLLAKNGLVNFHENAAERAIVPHSIGQLGIALVAVSLVGPFVEEVYFRGLLLRWLRARMPLVVAAIPNALLFAATHFRFASHVGIEGWVLTGALFIFGIFAVAWATATRSLWPAIAAHGMYNATLISAPLLAGHSP